jgi:hypothetical protein
MSGWAIYLTVYFALWAGYAVWVGRERADFDIVLAPAFLCAIWPLWLVLGAMAAFGGAFWWCGKQLRPSTKSREGK